MHHHSCTITTRWQPFRCTCYFATRNLPLLPAIHFGSHWSCCTLYLFSFDLHACDMSFSVHMPCAGLSQRNTHTFRRCVAHHIKFPNLTHNCPRKKPSKKSNKGNNRSSSHQPSQQQQRLQQQQQQQALPQQSKPVVGAVGSNEHQV